MIKYFNIHNLVRIKIDASSPYLHEQALYQLKHFEVPYINESELDLVVSDYENHPVLENPVII